MLELLLAIGAKEVGQLVLEQVLKLGQSALEDYVKDFFKNCLKGSVSAIKLPVLKKVMGEAIAKFLNLIWIELEQWEISPAEFRDCYDRELKNFVKDQAVRSILGQPFDTNCRSIDANILAETWTRYQSQPLPEEFDWELIAKQYVRDVKGIIKTTPELRSVLEAELQENMAEQLERLTGISPEFDLTQYRTNLQLNYGHLKLHTLDCTDQQYRMKLWSMFIEQTVREALPPLRYELPIDLKQRLQSEGRLEEDLSVEQLAEYRQEYFQKPSEKILSALGKLSSQHCVIIGDPGSGKSTILQYLAMQWVEGKTDTLPLLIELREYVSDRAQVKSFLEFLHKGCGADWQFDPLQLDSYLQQHNTLVMLDGLDEVFDPRAYDEVVGEIIRFAQQYPKARILVTSRIIGYNPDKLQHADFRHFTVQSLQQDEIKEFIDRWYDLALGADTEKSRLKQQLQDAISQSKAILNLAENPLLLTMMAILNRRQPLPRDRAELYDQASRVLLHNWDVDHKRLKVGVDAIGRQEKQAILRLIAYEMQASGKELAGNLIEDEHLKQILTQFLKDQGFSEPREKAGLLIQQLRERNFILCYRGADTYAFVHRTFLEYFCATEIVQQFEKKRSLTFEQLCDEIFGQHWQDQTWHEVLRLICGMIDAKFAGELIELLLHQQVDRSVFLSTRLGDERLKPQGVMNLLLAADCWTDIGNHTSLSQTQEFLLKKLQQEIEVPQFVLTYGAAFELLGRVAQISPETVKWVEQQMEHKHSAIRSAAVSVLVAHYRREAVPEASLFEWLYHLSESPEWSIRRATVGALVEHYRHHSAVLELLKRTARKDAERSVRWSSARLIADNYRDDPEVFDILCEVAQTDAFTRQFDWEDNPRQPALEALVKYYPDRPQVIEIVCDRAINDCDTQLREWAQQQLSEQNQLGWQFSEKG